VICRLTGRLVSVSEETAVIDLGGVGYEVMVPAATIGELHTHIGQDITLFTVQYFEGNPAGAHLIPRLVGFVTEADRDFFRLFTKVKGISSRRALRAMSVPAHQLAAAIEHGDTRLLTTLPEIGKKMASQILAEMQGHCQAFLIPEAVPPPIAELTDAQRIALDILVQWGDRRADAQRWIAAAVEADPSLKVPEDIVRAAYRAKQAL